MISKQKWAILSAEKARVKKLSPELTEESGGTVGKTIIGERKQRRDIVWRSKERRKVFDEINKWFDLIPKPTAIKNNGEIYAEAEKLKKEIKGENV